MKEALICRKTKQTFRFLTLSMNGHICPAQTRVIIIVGLGHDHTDACAPI